MEEKATTEVNEAVSQILANTSKNKDELMKVVADTVDKNSEALGDVVDNLKEAATKGQAEINEVMQDALKGKEEVTGAMEELTDVLKAQTEAVAPQVQEAIGSIKDAMDGNHEGLLRMLEGVVEPELIAETQEELQRFKVALKDIIEKMQQIAMQAASQVEKKAEVVKANAMEVASVLE